ncbi:hypothetical protein SESBI_33111 [Sesbania bispinosa]|nr:hypothetical protein SESBI_33111 [Sesbania bispinosa]
MAEIPVTNENPLTMEQRMERLEGSFSQILDLLKTVIPAKEVVNDNSNNDGNGDGGPSNKTNGENSPEVVIVTESSGPEVKVREEEAKMMDKMEMLEEKMRALQGIDVYGKLDQHLVAPEVPQPVSNPPPKWYNPVEMCKYHMGAPGHSIEKCWTFKLRVQRLRDAGQLFFEGGEGKSSRASVDNDPLLKH